ncbi:peptide/nickel transport system permease protein [Butyrivibrio sp. ob235]|uniref:ABC transporter permease n=1 Tax=Butyrivibrio sp. ob235 TaxID=1761780 RepID=UPI0008D363AF|nr:ABC transporter permease [Butyrivibrio sp. ob235]SEK84052.1 peptide/nickel transport system permease protein [Butyrivibrio sp. ob235]
MSEEKKENLTEEVKDEKDKKGFELDVKFEMHLDDANRVRVLSPGMMVLKRFLRNRLAIVGMVIIVAMFVFAFVGGALYPYSESKVFYKTEQVMKDFAGATEIDQLQFQVADGVKLPTDINSKALIAASKKKYVFETRDGSMMGMSPAAEDSDVYLIYTLEPAQLFLKGNKEFDAAVKAGRSDFEQDGKVYMFDGEDFKADVYEATEVAVASKRSFTGYSKDTKFSYEFYRNALVAAATNASSFEADGTTYSISDGVIETNGEGYAVVSNMNFNAIDPGTFLDPSYKAAALEAFQAQGNSGSFEYPDADGNMVEYRFEVKTGQYTIKKFQETRLIDIYAAPSKAHPVGTDANGMDLLARLMYGGRISLLIGFVVVFIEVFIGMVIGGVAGFFGGWVDNLLMRLVDVVYCIPAMPLYLILGSIMDYYQASPRARIYLLCVVMAVIGWVGIARIVRGQILSLREQEFMVAAEALGISTYRRIFKHLIPNVIPQLIVFASMGLGEVILSEASLSFLGLGIKYPAASWGSIINAVNDSYVMTNYLFVWLPAGTFILLTVLAFNFIGDGLRDAFDPKMKR